MARAQSDDWDDEWLTARVDPDLKRYIGMRAEQLGLSKSEYILTLAREDLQDVDYADVNVQSTFGE